MGILAICQRCGQHFSRCASAFLLCAMCLECANAAHEHDRQVMPRKEEVPHSHHASDDAGAGFMTIVAGSVATAELVTPSAVQFFSFGNGGRFEFS